MGVVFAHVTDFLCATVDLEIILLASRYAAINNVAHDGLGPTAVITPTALEDTHAKA